MKRVEEQYRRSLEIAAERSMSFVASLDQRNVGATADLATLRQRLVRPLPNEGSPPERVVEELARDVEEGLMASAGGRFFAWVIGGSIPAALAADWLSSTWDQNAALYATSPAAAVVEEAAGGWLKELLGLPPTSSFAFVTGCQMAHTTCLAAARHALLARRDWDVEGRGLFGAPVVRIVTSDQAHGTVERAARLLGLGEAQMELLPADERGTLRATDLRAALEHHRDAPTVVVLQAGDVNTGAYDPFDALVPVAREFGAWVHVDGAFGLWAAASPKFRHLLKGVEGADSWATDGHKWLNVPYDSGYAFVRDSEAHSASMSHHASYLIQHTGARDELDWNPEFSRRARGFPTYAALRQLGRDGVAKLVERCCTLAKELVTRVGELPGAEVVAPPIINQGLVRFPDLRSGATLEDHDRNTDRVISAIDRSGAAFFGGTTWRGRRAMRVSVSGWQTTEEDVDRVVATIATALAR